jgi:hypothetical protein
MEKRLWANYLHQAEEDTSQLTKSFWLGKFLQALPDEVLHSCREQQVTETPSSTCRVSSEHACSSTQRQTEDPVATTQQQTGHTSQQEGPVTSQQTTLAAKIYDLDSVVFQPAGRSRELLWLHVQRAEECVRQWPGGETSTALSPAVHRLVVGAMAEATAALAPSSAELLLSHQRLCSEQTTLWTGVKWELSLGERWLRRDGTTLVVR